MSLKNQCIFWWSWNNFDLSKEVHFALLQDQSPIWAKLKMQWDSARMSIRGTVILLASYKSLCRNRTALGAAHILPFAYCMWLKKPSTVQSHLLSLGWLLEASTDTAPVLWIWNSNKSWAEGSTEDSGECFPLVLSDSNAVHSSDPSSHISNSSKDGAQLQHEKGVIHLAFLPELSRKLIYYLGVSEPSCLTVHLCIKCLRRLIKQHSQKRVYSSATDAIHGYLPLFILSHSGRNYTHTGVSCPALSSD